MFFAIAATYNKHFLKDYAWNPCEWLHKNNFYLAYITQEDMVYQLDLLVNTPELVPENTYYMYM